MISIVADTHTHSMACDHAYSTIAENAEAAGAMGLRFLAVTEHGPVMTGAPTLFYFDNLKDLPRTMSGVVLLKGVEANILDYQGKLDIPDHILEKLEWVIASYHAIPPLKPATKEEHTRGWMEIANNPLVDVIGHCGDCRFHFDHHTVIKEFARTGKIVEINSHSFDVRPGTVENCPKIARLCAEYGVPIVLSSDAHHCTNVGDVSTAVSVLEKIGFPEELILNASYDRFLAVAQEKSGKTLVEDN